jgi:hypothetical protein
MAIEDDHSLACIDAKELSIEPRNGRHTTAGQSLYAERRLRGEAGPRRDPELHALLGDDAQPLVQDDGRGVATAPHKHDISVICGLERGLNLLKVDAWARIVIDDPGALGGGGQGEGEGQAQG